ncbi:uncharacterized protein LOC127834330 [Dreissena polymorpha]|uniref:Uncharacterized protein n=1 Tax=Dreissena polymorpha TaxID=45954 RepID=A0A9D4MU06_DREPO|nr:uncharacterized protein LOC127834330 [Dreissena polymorpha]XP_052216045.1 uncharacterized protein LOC127834330 [Dreissena polymorpha]XP_052216055.1 uncharacterized protein LOC127834330 [Dreissena polymorpha]KAH3883310.1 hypothetical protein DPMN_007264 [Dreissena polymorpha]
METEEAIERKVHHLGTFISERVDSNQMQHILNNISTSKGTKVTLQLSRSGLRYIKNSAIHGSKLVDAIRMQNLQFFTLHKESSNVLFVVAVGNTQDPSKQYQISVFRCKDAMDASLFATAFRRLSAAIRQSVTVVRSKPTKVVTSEEINWTLRGKEADNSKRELRKMLNIDGGGGETQQVTTTLVNGKHADINGHSEVYEHGVRIPLYKKGRPSRSERESFDADFSDNRSEVSEGALRLELESLSQELRDIKSMLEKSTGMTTASEAGSPRGFKPVAVEVHSHPVKPTVVVERRYHDDTVDTVFIDNEEVQLRPKTNGYTVTTEGSTTHVRVSVPDYRSVSERVAVSPVTTSTPYPTHDTTDYAVVKKTRPLTTSYESWKKSTMERNAGRQFHDYQDRIEWKSRSSRASHVVSAPRPRSALPTWSVDGVDSARVVEVRHHQAGVGPTYGHLTYNPHVKGVSERKSQSVRVKGMPTTVIKPIEKVYTGRRDAKHHSLIYRPTSASLRPSILVYDDTNGLDSARMSYIEPNNNLVKPDDNDDHLLDVSGIDLYSETPRETVKT